MGNSPSKSKLEIIQCIENYDRSGSGFDDWRSCIEKYHFDFQKILYKIYSENNDGYKMLGNINDFLKKSFATNDKEALKTATAISFNVLGIYCDLPPSRQSKEDAAVKQLHTTFKSKEAGKLIIFDVPKNREYRTKIKDKLGMF